MKNIRIILAATATAILMGCSPTLATKTVSVTTYPDGKKETCLLYTSDAADE